MEISMTKDLELRYSEIFKSVQGEGLYMGVPSVFLRTFGCNFRCKSFGLPKGSVKDKYNPEVKQLLDSGILKTAKRFEDLPLVHTGCDTYASIYPEFNKFAKSGSVEEVADKLLESTTNNKWVTPTRQDTHLILTGGEPLLWQNFWIGLLQHEKMRPLRNVTFETNGTRELSEDFFNFLNSTKLNILWSCSPKLSHSGEPRDRAIKPAVIKRYSQVNNSQLYLKFVIDDEEDMEEVEQTVHAYINEGVQCPVYLMPTGGCIEEYRENENKVAKMALENGYRFSPRLQLNLYGNNWGT